jgi:hypothetical protein
MNEGKMGAKQRILEGAKKGMSIMRKKAQRSGFIHMNAKRRKHIPITLPKINLPDAKT